MRTLEWADELAEWAGGARVKMWALVEMLHHSVKETNVQGT